MRVRRKRKPKPPPITGGIFDDYGTAARAAQTRADAHGYDYGIERCGFKGREQWKVTLLPQKKNRMDFELRCEVRMCSDLSKCRPGYGPLAESSRKNSP